MSKNSKNEMKTVNIRVVGEEWQRFKEITKKNNLDASKQMRMWIKQYLKEAELSKKRE